jgi:hypothetical protein
MKTARLPVVFRNFFRENGRGGVPCRRLAQATASGVAKRFIGNERLRCRREKSRFLAALGMTNW